MNSEILRLEEVEICYNGKAAVKEVSFQVKKGEILAVVGESGSGKSTILKGITGILESGGKVTKGKIYFRQEEILKLPPKRLKAIRGKEIGTVFQNCESSLCPIRTIGEQVYESIRAHEKLSKEEMKKRALELLKALDFEDGDKILNSYPFELSGGMIQRVGIMMAMILSPSVLLADEITSALDVIAQTQVAKELLRVNKTFNTSIIFVTHNIALAAKIADQIAVMKDGRLVEIGVKEEIMKKPKSLYTRKLLSAVPRLRRSI